jgi:hypothetical protein
VLESDRSILLPAVLSFVSNPSFIFLNVSVLRAETAAICAVGIAAAVINLAGRDHSTI